MKTPSNFDAKILRTATIDSFRKLDPRLQIKNPVMFVVFIGALWTSVELLLHFNTFYLQIAIWLWFTLLFANFAEAIAEGRGKAQAEALRKTRTNTLARKLDGDKETKVSASALIKGDRVLCEPGDTIPADGEVVEGIATVDESAITGESAPVIRESGGDRSAVTGGTRVLSDRIVIRITADPGSGFLDRMIAMVEGAQRQRTPNEIALGILLVSLTIIFILAIASLPAFAVYNEKASGQTNVVNMSMPV
ncbi:MAG: HAD-IC family P-type ATPase, partial [Chthoniobacterales bacterium]